MTLNPDKSCVFGIYCRVQSLKSTTPAIMSDTSITMSNHIKSLGFLPDTSPVISDFQSTYTEHLQDLILSHTRFSTSTYLLKQQ